MLVDIVDFFDTPNRSVSCIGAVHVLEDYPSDIRVKGPYIFGNGLFRSDPIVAYGKITILGLPATGSSNLTCNVIKGRSQIMSDVPHYIWNLTRWVEDIKSYILGVSIAVEFVGNSAIVRFKESGKKIAEFKNVLIGPFNLNLGRRNESGFGSVLV